MNAAIWSFLLVVTVVASGCGDGGPDSQLQFRSAAMNGDLSTMESLLRDPRVDINWRGAKTGTSALSAAASHGQLGAVEMLLRRGADPNSENVRGGTPLQYAAYHGYTDIAERLIRAGADVNVAEDQYGFTALAYAARKGHVEVIRLLLDAGAQRRAHVKDGRSPLELALQNGHANAANVLRMYQPPHQRPEAAKPSAAHPLTRAVESSPHSSSAAPP